MTLESLPYRQFTINKNIALFLLSLDYMDRRGKGILRMKSWIKSMALIAGFHSRLTSLN